MKLKQLIEELQSVLDRAKPDAEVEISVDISGPDDEERLFATIREVMVSDPFEVMLLSDPIPEKRPRKKRKPV